MVETAQLLGIKFKVCFAKPIKSLKLIAEAEEKICKRCKYHSIYVADELLTFEKTKRKINFRISLKPDHLSFYASLGNVNKEIAIEEFKIVMTEFKKIMYSYMGENPKIKNIVYTTGFNVTDDNFVEYVESLNFGFTKNGVSSSIKYGKSKNMNFLLRKYFIKEEYSDNYLNNIEEYIYFLM